MLSPAPLPPAPVVAQAGDVAAAYDEVAPRYDSNHQSAKDWAEDQIVAEQLQRVGIVPYGSAMHLLGQRQGHVLDVGCGTGALLDIVPIAPQHYLGIDVSRGMLARAVTKFPTHAFDCASAEDTGLMPDSFDTAVALYGVWNYLLNPFAGVAELFRVLRPGGRILLVVYSPRHVGRRSYVLNGKEVARKLFTVDDVHNFLAPYFTDVEVRGLSYVVDWLPRWLPRRAMLWLTRIEQKLLARRVPSLAFSMIITATKRSV